MTDLTDLQNRLSTAFGEPAARRIKMAPPPLSAEHVFENETAPEPEKARASFHVSPYVFGGAGLLASAAVLGFGNEIGLYAVAGGLGSVSVGAALLYLYRRARRSAARAVVEATSVPSESEQDALWQRKENAALHDSVHDALGDIVLTRDLNGRIVSANIVFRRLTGVSMPEGRTCEALGLRFSPAEKPGCFETVIETPDGLRTFLWHDVMVRDAGGGLVQRSLARDVTDEQRLARAREDARTRAEAASAAKSALLATVSHEIRTPLAGILGMASLLSRTKLSPEQVSYLEGMRQSGEALGQLVDELLDCASIEAGRFTVNPLVTDVRSFIEGVSEMLAHRAHGKGLEIGTAIMADVPERLEFDAARVRQVLFNLIGNAVKFTRDGGVLVKAAMDRSDLVITVTDTGPGMGETDLAQVFGEFSQGGEAADRSGGTGLGLPISARIMTALGGSLSASSKQDKGSTFTLRLPVGRVPVAGKGEGRSVRLGQSHVLLLAPAGPAASAILATLETLGARCRHVTSAPEAAMAMKGAAFTDIIVDHRLAAAFTRAVPAREGQAKAGPRRIFLVNPEERATRGRGDFDAWLIRPLRERTLTDVLTGRLKGVEKRDALNDNRPVPGFAAAGPEKAKEGGLAVLLAEDDPVNALLTRSALEKAGHRVTHASDFRDVLAVMEEGAARPDLLVTDLSMPGGDGAEVIARIRAMEKERGLERLPILVLTADRRRPIAQRARLGGADALLEKPAPFESIVAEIDALRAAGRVGRKEE